MTKRAKVSAPELSGPQGIMPTTDFREDPFGDGNTMSFRAGIMSSPVPTDFARLMREKGLAAPK